jgi:endoglucanase
MLFTKIRKYFVFILMLTFAVTLLSANTTSKVVKKWPDRLRGFCVGSPRAHMTNEQIFKQLAAWKVNVITVNFTYDKRVKITDTSKCPQVPPEMAPYRGMLDRLDKIVALAKKYKIFIILAGGGAVGNDKINVATGKTTEQRAEDEQVYLKNVIDLHLYLGKKYVNEPTILGYCFISEPHTPWIVKNWQTIVPQFIKAIRSVDKNSYLILSAGLWGFPDFGKGRRLPVPFKDPANKTLYGWHDYAPHNYTHQGVGNKAKRALRPRGQRYPGKLKMFGGSPLKVWDRAAQQQYMQPALDFMKKYRVKMFVGEFGVVRWAPGADKWLDDKISIFEENGISWSCHNYAGGWDGWNVTVGSAAKGGNVADGKLDTPRLKVLKKYFVRNKRFNKYDSNR